MKDLTRLKVKAQIWKKNRDKGIYTEKELDRLWESIILEMHLLNGDDQQKIFDIMNGHKA